MFETTHGNELPGEALTDIRELVELASDAALAIDDAHRVVAWNRAAERLLGYSSDEAVGRTCAQMLQAVLPGGEPMCTSDCEMFRCFRNVHPCGVPACRVRRKDGNWLSVSYSSLVMPRRRQRLLSGAVVAVVFLRQTEDTEADALPRGTLQIFTLGTFGVAAGGRRLGVEKWKRKQAVTLLKYLVTQLDRPVHRERILDCLWPDVDEARGWGRLKVIIYYLRRQLRESGRGEDVVRTVGDAYLLRRDAVWVDAHAFDKLVTEGRALQDKGRWTEALRAYDEAQFLYRGDYLEEDAFADWCAEERERLSEVYLEMLARKAECHSRIGQHGEAVQVCRKALVHDPCRESFHYALMEYLVEHGRPDWALAQFRQCRAMLAREFGAEPMPETQRLYRRIMAQGSTGAEEAHRGPTSVSSHDHAVRR